MPVPLNYYRQSRAAGPNVPAPAARERLAAWASSLERRLAAAEAVEAAEGAAVRFVIDALKRDYPEYALHQPNAWAKGFRDVQLMLRHNASAMVRDDAEWLEHDFLAWLKTILQAYSFHSPKFVRDTYVLLKEACRRELPAEAFALMAPYLDLTIKALANIREEYVEGARPAASRPTTPTTADAFGVPS